MADDKNPPLPDLESDLQMVAPDGAAATAPDESAGPKSAADLEAVGATSDVRTFDSDLTVVEAFVDRSGVAHQ